MVGGSQIIDSVFLNLFRYSIEVATEEVAVLQASLGLHTEWVFFNREIQAQPGLAQLDSSIESLAPSSAKDTLIEKAGTLRDLMDGEWQADSSPTESGSSLNAAPSQFREILTKVCVARCGFGPSLLGRANSFAEQIVMANRQVVEIANNGFLLAGPAAHTLVSGWQALADDVGGLDREQILERTESLNSFVSQIIATELKAAFRNAERDPSRTEVLRALAQTRFYLGEAIGRLGGRSTQPELAELEKSLGDAVSSIVSVTSIGQIRKPSDFDLDFDWSDEGALTSKRIAYCQVAR